MRGQYDTTPKCKSSKAMSLLGLDSGKIYSMVCRAAEGGGDNELLPPAAQGIGCEAVIDHCFQHLQWLTAGHGQNPFYECNPSGIFMGCPEPC